MNPLLAKQLKNHLPLVDPMDPTWKGFLSAVSEAYDRFQSPEHPQPSCGDCEPTLSAEGNSIPAAESGSGVHSLHRQLLETLAHQQGMTLCFRKTAQGFVHSLCRGQLARRLGWSSERVEGKTPRDFVSPVQLAPLESAYARAWDGAVCSVELRAAEGDLVVLAALQPLSREGVVTEVIVSGVEITALKNMEHELRSAKENAESADRAKSEFLAVMSHEIRTPLNAILGFAQLFRDSQLSDEQRSWLSTIVASGESLRELIDDILDFSKIEAGMLELTEEPVVLAELLESVAAMFRPRVKTKGLSFELKTSPDLPSAVATDGNRLRQILVNLVNNAVKFTTSGYVSVEASVVEHTKNPEGGRWLLRFAIRDSGIGIKPEHRDRMFRAFSQADSSTTRTYGGTGLGLAICKRLARALGGDIDYSSEPGEGSCFYFTVRASEASVPKTNASLFSAASISRLPKLRVLVAEDQPTNRYLMRQILRRLGYEAEFADNGKDAVVRTGRQDYDLVVMDLQMPEMDGIEAAREIRARVDRPQPRIIALTASTLAEQHDRCLEAGMDAVLTKPVRIEALFTELARTRPIEAA
jgi:signal transduction histidine kinase/ActR/RegA family two-component response regulator